MTTMVTTHQLFAAYELAKMAPKARVEVDSSAGGLVVVHVAGSPPDMRKSKRTVVLDTMGKVIHEA